MSSIIINKTKIERRLLRDCTLTSDGHILWTGTLAKSGHGAFTFEGKTYQPHVVSAMLYHENYNPDKWVLHKIDCYRPNCFAPSHLYQGNHSDNCKDMVSHKTHVKSRITHCPKGHEYTKENTILHKHKNSVSRDCRECKRLRRK